MKILQFADPYYLLLLLLLPFIAWLIGKIGSQAAILFSSVTSAKKIENRSKSRAGRILVSLRIATLALLIIALARPQSGDVNDSIEADGIDIVVTLDLSSSMNALDLSTSEEIMTRLDAAKRVVDDFIDKREFDRIGIVAFAKNAFVVSPLTLNHDWLKRNLDRLELGAIDGQGTAIGTAIGASLNRLRDHDGESRIIILLTDGENNSGELSPIAAAEAAEALGVKIYSIATGKQGNVPVAELDQMGRVRKDASGRPLFRGRETESRFDEAELTEIAEITGGTFFKASKRGDLEAIYDQIDALETTTVELRSHVEYDELFIWPAIGALALLILEQILRTTKYRRLP